MATEISETKEYREGWNANNRGDHFLSNPYFFASPRSDAWKKGFDENQQAWNNGESQIPEQLSIGETTPSALDII